MPLPVAPKSAPTIQLSPTFRGSSLVLCWFLPCPAGASELTLAQVNHVTWCPQHALYLFAHILSPPILHPHFGSSAQCSEAGNCLCFHVVMDKSSMVTFKIVINLTTGQGQIRHPLFDYLGLYLGSSLWISGNFSSFLLAP